MLFRSYDTLRNPETRARYERQYAPRAGRPAAPRPAPAPGVVNAHAATPGAPPAPTPPPAAEPPAAPVPSPAERIAADVAKAEGHVREARYWEAIQLLEPVLGHVRGAAEVKVRLLLGQSYMKNPNWLKRAADQLQIVIDADPRHAEAHYLLGSVFKANNLRQRAAAMFRRAVELNPRHAEAQRELNEIESPPPPAPPKRKLFG